MTSLTDFDLHKRIADLEEENQRLRSGIACPICRLRERLSLWFARMRGLR